MTPEQFERLPKWARDHIARLTRQRDDARSLRDQFLDAQTPSAFYTSHLINEPDRFHATRYLPNVSGVAVKHDGLEVELFLDQYGVGVRFCGKHSQPAAIAPQVSNVVRIVKIAA